MGDEVDDKSGVISIKIGREFHCFRKPEIIAFQRIPQPMDSKGNRGDQFEIYLKTKENSISIHVPIELAETFKQSLTFALKDFSAK